MKIIVPLASILAQLDAVKTASLDGGSLRLYQNDYTPVPLSVAADFTVATFTGYANKTIATWGSPFIDATNTIVSLAGLEVFAATGSTIGNVVYGCYYLDSAGALVWAARFDAPKNIGASGQTVAFVPKYTYGQAA